MLWMNDLTIAIIEEDCHKIGQLIDCVPKIEDIATAKRALVLITQAIFILENAKRETFQTMQKIKQTKAFLLSNEAKRARFIG